MYTIDFDKISKQSLRNTKNVLVNKQQFKVLDNEFCQVPHQKFNNLQILQHVSETEVMIGFVRDLLETLPKDSVSFLYCYDCCYGGIVPIQCSKYFSKVIIFYSDNNYEQIIEQNVVNHNITNIEIVDNQSFKQKCDFVFEIHNDNFVKFYPNNHSTNHFISYEIPEFKITLQIDQSLNHLFVQEFRYYLQSDNKTLNYNNLIHLTMIVKNAGDGFEQVLKDNLPHFDRWTILDTGSTDNTVDIIRRTLKDKKGTLYQEPFINFRDSRNHCLELAGTNCKFIMMLDDTYCVKGNLRKFLTEVRGDQFGDSYSPYIFSDDVQYTSNRIIKSEANLRYIFLVHEVIQQEDNVNVCIPMDEMHILDVRSPYMEKRTMDRKLYDLKLLQQMETEDPDNPRHLYYIAQTYTLLEQYELAFQYYIKRVNHPVEGNPQEKYDACFEAARTANFKLNRPWEECEMLYRKSFELDNTRPESLYFIGIHYYLEGQNSIAFEHLLQGYKIGYPQNGQLGLKPTLSFFYLPKFLSILCLQMKQYELGEEVSNFFVARNQHLPANDHDLMTVRSLLDIFTVCNKFNIRSLHSKKQIVELDDEFVDNKPIMAFVVPGNFRFWSGQDIETEGLGGSETFIVELTNQIQKLGKYNVVVFCITKTKSVFNGVCYKPLKEYVQFVKQHDVELTIVSRYSEYIPFILETTTKSVYLLCHDTTPSGIVIPKHPKLKRIICLSKWHIGEMIKVFPVFSTITAFMYHGINMDMFQNATNKTMQKQRYKFIYSSFANRGLLILLQMWPHIQLKYPSASLYIHCDIENEWLQQLCPEHMKEIKNLLNQLQQNTKNQIYYMGWTNKYILAESWKTADVWFYPCIFEETFCLTALEAAITKTLAITTSLAALNETVGNRGITISGDPLTTEWQQKALQELFQVLENPKQQQTLIDKNYEWAQQLTWENQTKQFLFITEN
jgi:hypothetical protein